MCWNSLSHVRRGGQRLQTQRLFPAGPALGLLFSALTIAGTLAGLIVALGAISGGHFNPLITALQWLGRERDLRCTLAYIAAQIIGAVGGAVLANIVFNTGSNADGPLGVSWTLGMSELVASAGLMVIVFGSARSRRNVL